MSRLWKAVLGAGALVLLALGCWQLVVFLRKAPDTALGSSGSSAASRPLLAPSAGVTPAPAGHLVIHRDQLIRSSFERGRLELFDGASHRRVSTIPLRGNGEHEPYGGALVIARGRLFVDGIFSKWLEVFDLTTMESVGFVPTSDANGALCASADGGRVVHAGTAMLIIDSATLASRTVPLPPNQRGSSRCTFSPDGKTVHIGIQRPLPVLLSYDLERDRWLAPLTLSLNGIALPSAMAMSADGARLYVGLFQGRELLIVDLGARNVLMRHNMDDPLALALTPDSLFVVTREPTARLNRLDPATLAPLRVVPLEGNGQGNVEVLVDGDDVIVESHRAEDELTWLSLQSLR